MMTSPKLRLLLVPRNVAVSASSFIRALDQAHGLLEEIDRTMSGGRYSLTWFIGGVGNPRPWVEFVPELLDGARDIRSEVIGAAIDGLEAISRGPTTPAFFSEEALERAKGLASILGRDVATIRVLADHRDVEINQTIAAHVEALLGKRYEDIGSVEGSLEAISVHGRRYFNVYDALTGRRVECAFEPDMQEKAAHALGKRVWVRGLVSYTAQGKPLSVRVMQFEEFPPREVLPSTATMQGLVDLTDGIDSVEHVRRLRDD